MEKAMYREGKDSTFTHNEITAKVDDLIDLSSNYPILHLLVSDLEWVIQYADSIDYERVDNANIDIPIIVTNDGNLTVLDGFHRLVKAKSQDKEIIKAILVPFSEVQKLNLK
jgi:hypothetical protein